MWTSIKEKEQSKMERAYEQEKDLPAVLKQVAIDLREESDQALYSQWGINPKEVEWCDIKIRGVGDEGVSVEFVVNQHVGGLRLPVPVAELDKRMAETEKVLGRYESAFRKLFKEKTGKALRLSKAKTFVNREQVALNGLYRFFAIKQAMVRTELDGNPYPENSKDLKDRVLK